MIKSVRYGAAAAKEKKENRSMCTHRVLWGRKEIRVYHMRISRYR